jgi:hypothetical protein
MMLRPVDLKSVVPRLGDGTLSASTEMRLERRHDKSQASGPVALIVGPITADATRETCEEGSLRSPEVKACGRWLATHEPKRRFAKLGRAG